ncbi:MAG: Hpt domain-containing protein [Bdellovibrionota bacterium]
MNEALDLDVPIEMKRTYLTRRSDDLATLRSALSRRDYIRIREIGHQLSGNARSFGFLDLEQIALRMETLSEEPREAASVALEFEVWLKGATALHGTQSPF